MKSQKKEELIFNEYIQTFLIKYKNFNLNINLSIIRRKIQKSFFNLKKEIEYCFVTGFCMGLLPKLPGTFASLYALILSLYLIKHFDYAVYLFITYIFFILGLKSIKRYEKENNVHDSPETAIDEVIGMFFAISLSYPFLEKNDVYILFWQGFIIFILFRIFDILKPGYIKEIDKNVQGEIGTILDDVIAGFYSAIIFIFINSFFF